MATVIKNMVRGKSPRHDNLSIEHLQHAGDHLPRILAMFFTLCVGHCHLPEALIKSIVVLKNKTGDTSDIGNYRPSLSPVIAKVLDDLLDKHMENSIKLYDAQFGFRPGLSTESAIPSVKHTVQYYADRNAPIVAYFFDLSKAFDLVNYDLLWPKLSKDTQVSAEVIELFKF